MDKVCIELREISFEDAKKEIADYYKCHPGKTIYVSDLIKELRIDLETVMDAVEELEKEGTIGR